MKHQKKSLLALLLALTMLLSLLAGCSKSTTEEADDSAAVAEVELTIPYSQNVGIWGIDPALENGNGLNGQGVTEPLFALNNENNELELYLTTSYNHPDDYTWIITLRDDINFSNGEKMTAQIVQNALQYYLDKNPKAPTALDIKEMSSDGQVLTIKTNAANATLPKVLTGFPVFYCTGETVDYESAGVIGTGAYILESWDSSGNRELVRNDNYWQGKPAAAKIHVKPISDASALTLALQSGEIDWAGIQTSDAGLFENNKDYNVTEFDNGRLYFMFINPNTEFTKDPAFRAALQYAFDRQSYIDGVYEGRGKPANTIFPDWTGYYDASVSQPNYDKAQAQKLLQEAGYVDTDNDGILEKDGQKVKLNITTYDSNGFTTVSQAIQSSLKEIGIDSEIKIAEQIADELGKCEYNIALYGHSTLTNGDSLNMLESIFTTNGYENYNKMNDDTINAAVANLKASVQEKDREQYSIEAQKAIYDTNDFVFLTFVYTYTISNSNIQNMEKNRNNNYFLWKVTKNA